jgi:pimeloyl-ACP methyl ester carboxylesterase
MTAPLHHRTIEVGGIRLHVVEAGEGPLVVLLHGFPEHWYTWRKQIPALAAAGYRVLAPDMRGYNLSDKPARVADYGIGRLCDDVAELVRAAGADRAAAIVGHDWGGGVAWAFAARHPAQLERLVTLNSPHPMRLLRAFGTARQLAKSWYMFAFQVPWLPEAMMRRDGFALLRRSMSAESRTISEEEMARYVEAWSQPGALEGGVRYYRAMFHPGALREAPKPAPVEAPTLVLWGEGDSFLGPELADPDPRWVPHARVVRIPGARHFVHHDEPEEVNRLVVEFLRS